MITSGFDIGTRFVKTCIVDGDNILGFSIQEIGRDIDKIIKNSFKDALSRSGIKKRDVKKAIATGYGSSLVKDAEFTLSEAPCIARAANTINDKIRTVIDTGGLFINIISVDKNGLLDDTITNDRCAAGSGKFLEVISEAIEIPFDSISDCALKSNSPYTIKSSCAVFAESEIISMVNIGMDSSDIIAGVMNNIASRTLTLIQKIDAQDDIVLSGGISKIPAFRSIFERHIKRNVSLLPIDPQITAAYGAALIAQGKQLRKKVNASGRA